MSWDDLHQEILVWASLSHSRPFSKLSTKPIIDGALEGLQKENPDLEAATLAVDELSQRSRLAASNGVDTIQRALDRIGHETIPWLVRARQNLKHLKKPQTPKNSYQTTLYVILRDGYSEKNGRYGIYVGQTSKSAEERCEEHLSGIRAARGLQEHGIQLLYSLMWPWQKVPRANDYNLYYESALHLALEINNDTGPKVTGDSKNITELPCGFQIKLKRFLFENT